MSLRRALEALPHDRALESCARDILDLFRRNRGKWFTADEAGCRCGHDSLARDILAAFRTEHVLDFEGAPPRYRYNRDPLLDIEVERFLRRAEHHESRVRDNVARFRKRHGAP